MKKTIMLTGATDGIGLETAKSLAALGHDILLHGRNADKLAALKSQLSSESTQSKLYSYIADLSIMEQVKQLALTIKQEHSRLDVLINNAGIYMTADKVSADGFDIRFAVNTFAPYLLTKELLPLFNNSGRVINVSSAAQAPVEPDDLTKTESFSDGSAYAKSKLAITMWSRKLALDLGTNGPAIIAVNPASLLGSKMVQQAYGVAGGDLKIGADILVRAALSDEFASASGEYFDNDSGQFGSPHKDALDLNKITHLTSTMDNILAKHTRYH